jgi:acyl phosphate:glycerol-3-phosphate acyltransferase
MIIAKLIYVIILGYIIGSIPFGLLVAKYKAKVDIRKYGSGKIGTTNVLRTAGLKAAILVLVGDLLKGVIPVIIAGIVFGKDLLVIGNFGFGTLIAQVLAALAAMVGHNWSMFMKFKGGRGVATFFGGLLALCPPAAIIGGEILFATAGITRFMSFGSIVGTVSSYVILVLLTVFYKFPMEYLGFALIGGLIIIVMHRDNINRLLAGTERKLGEKAERAESTTTH